VSENGLWAGAADTTGRNPTKRIIDQEDGNKCPIAKDIVQKIMQKL